MAGRLKAAENKKVQEYTSKKASDPSLLSPLTIPMKVRMIASSPNWRAIPKYCCRPSAGMGSGISMVIPAAAALPPASPKRKGRSLMKIGPCLLYTSDAADDLLCVDLGGRRIIKKKKKTNNNH